MTYDAIFVKNIDICKLFEENSVNVEENVLEDGILFGERILYHQLGNEIIFHICIRFIRCRCGRFVCFQ